VEEKGGKGKEEKWTAMTARHLAEAVNLLLKLKPEL